MKSENEIIITEDGKYKISCGNAITTDAWETYEDAVKACAQDDELYQESETIEEYENLTELEWE